MGTLWTKVIDYWYGEYSPPLTIHPAPHEYICTGCGSRITEYTIREYRDGINKYFCSVKCFEKPQEKQAMLY